MDIALGDRMKLLEGQEAQRRAIPGLPVCVRIDGKAFHAWTRGLGRPFDERMEMLRRRTTHALILATGATIAYHQSDEITLILFARDPKTALYVDGRFQKLVSHCASIATAVWNANVPELIPEKAGTSAMFDARAWAVPSLSEAANVLLWREDDATKNSISMAARAFYSHGALAHKSGREMHDMLHARGINWNNYPAWAKRGTYMGRRTLCRKFTPEELAQLPPMHNAHKNPGMEFERSSIEVLDMPPFRQVTNRVDAMFGATPITNAQDAGLL